MANFFSGTPATTERIERFTPQQQQLQNLSVQRLMQMLQPGGSDIEPILQRARTDFRTQTIPGIAERFTALGGSGQRSSAFPAALGAAGSGLEEALASLRSQHTLGQQGLLSQLALQPSFEQVYIPRSPGALETGGSAILGLIAQLLPKLLPLFL